MNIKELTKERLYKGISTNRQSGIVMFVTLIALVMMLLASIALIRSTDTNLLIAGHLSFKRDLINQAERTIPVIRNQFLTGLLANEITRGANNPLANYFATIQPSINNSNDIPDILLNINAFDAVFGGNNIVDNASQTTIRYVIDRMCLTAGTASANNCTLSGTTQDDGGYCTHNCVPGDNLPAYRLSMRVTGPRNTETYLQTIFRNQ